MAERTIDYDPDNFYLVSPNLEFEWQVTKATYVPAYDMRVENESGDYTYPVNKVVTVEVLESGNYFAFIETNLFTYEELTIKYSINGEEPVEVSSGNRTITLDAIIAASYVITFTLEGEDFLT